MRTYGVKAKPWGKSRKFKGAFIFAGHAKSGQAIAGGHVFKRSTKASTPIEKMYGPSIPKEMLKDETAEAFEAATGDLANRIAHEIRVISKGVIS